METTKTKMRIMKVREEEAKKLSTYKIHPRESYWEVIKRILEEKDIQESKPTRSEVINYGVKNDRN